MSAVQAWGAVAIGGTTCSVALAVEGVVGHRWLGRETFANPGPPEQTIDRLVDSLEGLVASSESVLVGIGVICGGPLDEESGFVLSPPNLPGWGMVDVATPFERRFGLRPRLANDADAGVLAEWEWGAARGSNHCAFLTLGTGLGAGLILNRQLYRGSLGLAGELGHWRLAPEGPTGHGKEGSFEGFASGNGIRRQAQALALERLEQGTPVGFAPDRETVDTVTALTLGEAAAGGDPDARDLWTSFGASLGAGLALLIDLLNLEVVVLGGIFPRRRELIEPSLREALEREALPAALAACRIVPAELGERIADWSALAIALIGTESMSAAAQINAATAFAVESAVERRGAAG